MRRTAGSNQKGFTLLEAIVTLVIMILIAMMGIPKVLENRRLAQGESCNSNLDTIFSAKEQVAYKLNVRPGGPVIPFDADLLQMMDPYTKGLDVTEPCPGGGTYRIGDLNETYGQVVVPECSIREESFRDGLTYEENGLHIHRRSYDRDANGRYRSTPSMMCCRPDM